MTVMEQRTDSQQQQPLLINTVEAAALLGVDHKTFLRWARLGLAPAPARARTNQFLWSRKGLEDWVAAGCPTNEEAERRKGA